MYFTRSYDYFELIEMEQSYPKYHSGLIFHTSKNAKGPKLSSMIAH